MATKTNTAINGKNYYRIKRVVGYEMIDGEKKSITKQFYGRSKSEAEAKFRAYKDEQIRKEYEYREELQQNINRSVGDLMDYYVTNVLENNSNYSVGTRKLYINSYKCHLKNSKLAFIPISELKASAIQEYYNKLDVSESALKTLHKFLAGFIKWAVACDYCTNVLEAVSLPQKKQNKKSEEIIIWNENELKMINKSLSQHPYYPCILLALYGGLRISEILGLKWDDIQNDVIHIRRQYYRGTIKEPKAKSFRDVPMHPKIKKALKNVDHKSDYIFVTDSGRLIDYHNFTTSLERAYNSAGITPKKFHAFRATFITNLCKAGARLEVASKLAGHTSVNVTAKYYTYISAQESADAIELLK